MGDRCRAPGRPAGLRRKPSTAEGKLRAGRGGERRPRPRGSVRGRGSRGQRGQPGRSSLGPPCPAQPRCSLPSRPLAPSSSSSFSSSAASCGPPASRRRRVAGEPRRPVCAVAVTVAGGEATGFPFPVRPLRLHLASPSPTFPMTDRPGAGAGGGRAAEPCLRSLSRNAEMSLLPTSEKIKLVGFFFFSFFNSGRSAWVTACQDFLSGSVAFGICAKGASGQIE